MFLACHIHNQNNRFRLINLNANISTILQHNRNLSDQNQTENQNYSLFENSPKAIALNSANFLKENLLIRNIQKTLEIISSDLIDCYANYLRYQNLPVHELGTIFNLQKNQLNRNQKHNFNKPISKYFCKSEHFRFSSERVAKIFTATKGGKDDDNNKNKNRGCVRFSTLCYDMDQDQVSVDTVNYHSVQELVQIANKKNNTDEEEFSYFCVDITKVHFCVSGGQNLEQKAENRETQESSGGGLDLDNIDDEDEDKNVNIVNSYQAFVDVVGIVNFDQFYQSMFKNVFEMRAQTILWIGLTVLVVFEGLGIVKM